VKNIGQQGCVDVLVLVFKQENTEQMI